MRHVYTIFCIGIATVMFLLYSVSLSSVQAEEGENISTDILPEDVIYDIDNMKPGDWAPRKVTVKNSGKDDLFYQVDIINEGPDKLFNELLLEVTNDKHTLYEGKLADFSGFQGRKVETSGQEELEFTVHFPEHSGNDYQGLRTIF